MNDTELIDLIACTWISNGGDGEGFGWLWGDIKERIEELEEDCPICHGAGASTDHHDPCSECGGSGKVGGER